MPPAAGEEVAAPALEGLGPRRREPGRAPPGLRPALPDRSIRAFPRSAMLPSRSWKKLAFNVGTLSGGGRAGRGPGPGSGGHWILMSASSATLPQRAISAETKLAVWSGVSGPGLAPWAAQPS